MTAPDFFGRTIASLKALAICWLLTAGSIGIYGHDIAAFYVALLWSVPLLGVGWILAGLPLVAAGGRILRWPVVLVAAIGAVDGVAVILLPTALLWLYSHGTEHYKLDWAYFRRWPSFCAAIGACGAGLYYWLLGRAAAKAGAKSA
jgi:hypothetical protein